MFEILVKPMKNTKYTKSRKLEHSAEFLFLSFDFCINCLRVDANEYRIPNNRTNSFNSTNSSQFYYQEKTLVLFLLS